MSPALRQRIEAHHPAARKWTQPLRACAGHRLRALEYLREGEIEKAEACLENAWFALRFAHHFAKGPVLP